MALDLFLQIDGIVGESRDDFHVRWIELLAFDEQLRLEPNPSEPNAAPIASHVFRVEKLTDASSPKLALACCSGQQFELMVVEMCNPGRDKRRIMVWKLGDVVITSRRSRGRCNDELHSAVEELIITCRRVEWGYAVIGPTGQAQGNLVSYWDFDSNTGG